MQHHPYLKPHHKLERLKWCRPRLDWGFDRWGRVWWSDEVLIEQVSKRRDMAWLRPGDERRRKPDKRKTAKLKLSGSFGGSHLGHLTTIEKTLNAEKYITILKEDLIPAGHYALGRKFIFMQDGHSAHRAKVTMKFLSGYVKRHRFIILPWPACSPDLNPIENIWAEIGRILAGKIFWNLRELENEVRRIWDHLSKDYLTKLIESMPKRVAQVVERKGDKCDY